MLRTWKLFGLPAILVVALTAAPCLAGGEKEAEKALSTLQKQIDALSAEVKKAFDGFGKDMKEVQDDLKDLREKSSRSSLPSESVLRRFVDLDKAINDLRADMDNLKKRSSGDIALYPPSDKKFDDIVSRLSQIEQMLSRMQNGSSRVAMSAPTQAGRVVLYNGYPEELLFIVNERSYRVAPGSSQTLDGQSPGTLAYEVISPTWGVRARTTTSLNPNETLTITAR